jgi:hypothetical protein
VYVPGELAPEIADALTAVERAAGRRPRRQGFRLSAAERRAIERRGVLLATTWLQGQGYSVKDVGTTRSYDLDARKGMEHLSVEVKSSTSEADEVILTRKEVELQRDEHPANMLIVVSAVVLDRSTDPPEASGGVLRQIGPWDIVEDDLLPIAYRYRVPPT